MTGPKNPCGSAENATCRHNRPDVKMALRIGPARRRTASADRRPGAIRVAAGRAADDFRLALDVDRVRVGTAAGATLDVHRPRYDIAVAAGPRILPADRRTN